MAFLAGLPALGGAGAGAGAGASAAGGAASAASAASASTAAASSAAAAGASAFSTAANIASLAAAGIGAFGAIEQGAAASAAAKANANLSRQNAKINRENAEIASQSGDQRAAMSEQKTRAYVGAIKTNQGASGVDVNTGSALDVQSSAAQLGELDALTVRSNATREAYGYKVQAEDQDFQASLDDAQAKNAGTAGYIGAASTFLGSVGDASSNYSKYLLQTGFN